jgi:hypothetical protein
MNENLIPSDVMKHFVNNPKIGRKELMKKAGISESNARFYCKAFKEKKKNLKIKDSGIVVWDLHYPEIYKEGWNCVLKVISDFKPTIFIFGGDQLDLAMISVFNKKKPKLLENERISKTYKKFNKDIFLQLEALLPENCTKYWLDGNHEERVTKFIEGNPNMEGLIEIENHINFNSWIRKEYKEVLKIGHMHFSHGIWWNKYHAERNARAYQKNIFTGHAHTSQLYTSISPVDALPRQSVSVGCMCIVNPEYRKEEPNHWINQFLIFYILSDDTFRYEIITIMDGICIVNGKLYDGNK